MNELQREIGAWSDETFGPGMWPLSGIVQHLKEEIRELEYSMKYGYNEKAEDIEVECADIAILLLTFAHRADFSLDEAIRNKHRINQKRMWKKPDSNGIIKHVK